MLEYFRDKGLPLGDENAGIRDDGSIEVSGATIITLPAPALAIRTTYDTAYATVLTIDNDLYLIGINSGSIAKIDTTSMYDAISKIVINRYGILLLTSTGKVYKVYFYKTIEQVIHDTVVDIAVGHSHSLFLTSTGEVYGNGDNEHCQLHDKRYYLTGASNSTKLVTPFTAASIACGSNYSLVLDTEGTVWIRGRPPNTPHDIGTWTALEKNVDSIKVENDVYISSRK